MHGYIEARGARAPSYPPPPGYGPVSEVKGEQRRQHRIRLSKRGGRGGVDRRGFRLNFFKEGEGLETRWVCDEVNIFGENIFIHVINVLIYRLHIKTTKHMCYINVSFLFFSSVFH